MNSPRIIDISRLVLLLTVCFCSLARAGTLGRVVPIGGQASDLVLDETRGVLYVANFTAARIDVMSLKDLTIQRSINVAGQPAGIALSNDRRWLVVVHFGNFQAPNSPNNALTLINLESGERQTFGLGNTPLGVAFGLDDRALIITSKEFLQFDPATGATEVLSTISGVTANALPQPPATAPTQIVGASVGVSGNGAIIYGLTDTFQFKYDSSSGTLRAGNYSASPPLGPRAIAVNHDGTAWMAGWALYDGTFHLTSQYANVTGALSIGSVAIDSRRNLIYCQMSEVNATFPTLIVADADNLNIRERYNLSENLSGKSLLSADSNTLYSLSESGVTVFPVGRLAQTPRVRPEKTHVVFRGNSCDRGAITQEVVIGGDGAPADYVLISNNPAVRITNTRGTTPATVGITVDMASFAGQKGTSSVTLSLTSSLAVNVIPQINVLINAKDPDQRGNIIPLTGKLVDVLADPQRDRFFVLRQDTNEVLVFEGKNLIQTATLRTYNTPKSMAITFDRRWLLVGSDNSKLINVWDLETLQADRPSRLGDYPQSIAASANAILVATRTAGGGDNTIQRVDMTARIALPLPSLGVFQNKIARDTVMVAANNGRSILIAQSDGNVMLYDSVQDTFTVSRKLTPILTGAYAASNFDKFVIGNTLLNSSLVAERRFESDSGQTSGFAFLDNLSGFRFTAPTSSSPGVLQRVDLTSGGGIRPTRTSEAPLLGSAADSVFTRTLAPLYSRSAIVSLTTTGLTAFPWDYDAATVPPRIDRIVNAADFSSNVAPGGLIAVFGTNLSPISQGASQVPLPTALAESCLTVNGVPVPMILASPDRINAQLPFAVDGNTTLVLRTPGGVSDNFNLVILPGSPAIFRSLPGANEQEVASIFRNSNNQLTTPSNPVRRNELLTIFVTGLGRTNPAVETGVPAPTDVLSIAIIAPTVTIGGVPVEVLFAGLVPNQIGVYQINVRTNGLIPTGMSVPLQIAQGSARATVPVRVVD